MLGGAVSASGGRRSLAHLLARTAMDAAVDGCSDAQLRFCALLLMHGPRTPLPSAPILPGHEGGEGEQGQRGSL